MDVQQAVDRMFRELQELRQGSAKAMGEFRQENSQDHQRLYDKIDAIVAAAAANAQAIAVLNKEFASLHCEHREARVDRSKLRSRLDEVDLHLSEERGKARALSALIGAGGGGVLWILAEVLRHIGIGS